DEQDPLGVRLAAVRRTRPGLEPHHPLEGRVQPPGRGPVRRGHRHDHEGVRRRQAGDPHERARAEALRRLLRRDARHEVDHLGVDVVDDGEMGKPGFIPYVNERLSGFEPDPEGRGSPWSGSREVRAFPEFYEWFSRAMPSPAVRSLHMVCTGPVVYKGHQHVQADIENLKTALAATGAPEAFIPAISPTSVEDWQRNAYYKTDEEYLFAIADAMREEYKAIVDAGFLVQIDDPHLATHYVSRPELSVDQVRRWAEVRVE